MINRKRIVFASFVFVTATAAASFGLITLAGTDQGSAIIDNYESSRPANKQQKVKLDLALKLLSGHWSENQKAVLLEAINQPTRDLESKAIAAFSPDEAKDVFYKIGTADISDLRTVYKMPFGKGSLIADWTAERKANLWRQNFALGFVRYDLTIAQQRFLIELSQALPMTKEQSSAWDAEAATLFTRDVGRDLFATIGNSTCQPGAVASIKGYFVESKCVCTTGSGNWSCTDSCHGAGGCTVDPGNCGFLWLWDCNGSCSLGDGEIQ